jgi:DHA1 family bicyclomycin/chloramphenicol resistance-like MFS transporter
VQFLTVLLMEILAGVEVDIFVPSFPELQRIFQLTPFMVELTLGVNLFAHCLSALFVGSMGDRYGRKPIIIYCLIIFIIGSVLCVFAGEFWHLLVGRFLQGIGISGPAVLAYVIVADMYTIEQQQKLLGILNGAIALAMACAPVVGSYVNLYFSWRGNFVILLALGVLSLLLTILFVPKREPDYSVSLNLKEYLPLLRSKKAVYAMSLICMLTIGYWVFIPLAPILYMDDMGVGLKEFGFYQGSLAATFSIVSLFCTLGDNSLKFSLNFSKHLVLPP